MKIIFTLDYELFLGSETGSVEKCLIEPMTHYLSVAEKYGMKFTLFVDATYLYMLNKYASEFPQLSQDFESIKSHLVQMNEKGHDIQLHIHPHWFYSIYDGKQWHLDDTHYKLSDLSLEEADKIFKLSKDTLDGMIKKRTIAFRAGGFSAQPTKLLNHLFNKYGMRIDSSVYPGNFYDSSHQKYDYRDCPDKDIYSFSEDICKEDIGGIYLEVPLSVYDLSPSFYWKLSFYKLLRLSKHRNIGDGVSVETAKSSILERLTRKTKGFATIDGYKISYLYGAYLEKREQRANYFTILGHPKLATLYSIRKLDNFLKKIHRESQFITISECNE